MFNPDISLMFNADINLVSPYFLPSFEDGARSLKVEAITAPVHDDVEIETAIIALGREPGGGLVVMPDIFTSLHRAPIILAAARNNVPAVYWGSDFVRDGGLLPYGFDLVDTWRRAATYVDRILRGEGCQPCWVRRRANRRLWHRKSADRPPVRCFGPPPI